MENFNDNLEIEGDLRDEYDALQEAEKKTVLLSDLISDLIDKVWTDISPERIDPGHDDGSALLDEYEEEDWA